MEGSTVQLLWRSSELLWQGMLVYVVELVLRLPSHWCDDEF